MKNFEIVKATTADALKANEFLTRLIQDEKQYDPNINEHYRVNSFYEHAIESSNTCLLIAKKDSEIVGFLYGYFDNNDKSYLHKIARLDALFVAEKHRSLKIGSNLIQGFKKCAIAMGCKYIEVMVLNANKYASEIYEKHGFKNMKTIMSLDI